MSESLKLFSENGYEAVSMRDIAGNLGITQGALYRHYAGKRDIFESILRRMEEYDREYAEHCHLPTVGYADAPKSYREISRAELVRFTIEMFRHWTENEFASAFRRMLTLEQYRSPEMGALYQQYFGRGVLCYLTDLFRENGCDDPESAALQFYAPFYLFLNQYDVADAPSEYACRLERILS
ncbi:MAG: helix-turn-helix domain containing protein [Victivallaceae bacterium]|nr:helix-turn-helix domain containing protein [Victivallaceae bacterium]